MPRKKERTLDAYIGARVRMRGLMLNMSQEVLSGKLGVTFQQVQKYEKGLNRISASRLFELAQALRVPVGYFYDGLMRSNLCRMPMGSMKACRITRPSRRLWSLCRAGQALSSIRLFCALMMTKSAAVCWLWSMILPASPARQKGETVILPLDPDALS